MDDQRERPDALEAEQRCSVSFATAEQSIPEVQNDSSDSLEMTNVSSIANRWSLENPRAQPFVRLAPGLIQTTFLFWKIAIGALTAPVEQAKPLRSDDEDVARVNR
jgi:hypothetical protein